MDEEPSAYPGGTVLRDRAGNVIRVSLGPGDVDCRPYYRADPGDWIVKALVAVEDDAYWKHCGVRPLSILRALCQNLFYRRRISGASTITMQTVRLIRPHPKTLWWKCKESVMALKMELSRDKLWILSQYLNRAPFGSNLVGIEAAAAGWFGKSASQLGISEAAMLAGMVQAPSRFRPDRNFDNAMRRRNYVLERMFRTGCISRSQMESAKGVTPVVRRAPRPFAHPHFCDWVLRRLASARATGRSGNDFVTTLDADVQSTVEKAVCAAAEKGGYSVAAVVIDARTGAVVSLACSGDYFDRKSGQVNTALAPRPAGSTLKPFLAAFALDRGYVAPDERLTDAPVAFKGYRPVNFDASYRGKVSLRDALILSLNVPFVSMLRDVGVERFGTNLRSLGFEHMSDRYDSIGLGMAIGNVEVTLVELVSAYATFARSGVYRPLTVLANASDDDCPGGGERIFSAGASYLISDMLSGDERSYAAFGHVADVRSSRFAWKTGTSSAYRDAWTVAWNPEYAVGVWCGHKTSGFGDKTLVGARAAAPVAWTVARALYPQNDGPWFAQPREVETKAICAASGLPAGPNCPTVVDGRFLRGHTMTSPCGVHRLDADGNVAETKGAAKSAHGLSIVKPENDARFVMVPGMAQQRIVCRVAGNADGSRLWWFVDGRPCGMTVGSQPFVVEMTDGRHLIECSTAEGETSSVSVTVRRFQDNP